MTKSINIPKHLIFTGEIPPSAAEVVLADLVAAEAGLSDWQRDRLGKITASRLGLVKRLKTGDWGETALSYLYDLIGEHLTGQPSQTFTGNDATDWGNEYEAEALAEYTKRTGRKVRRNETFFQHPELTLVGGTPDGIVGEKGLIEVKCPFTFKNHLRTVITRTVPDEYHRQVLGQLWLSGREWVDFVSYDPRIPTKHKYARLVVIRVDRKSHAPALQALARDVQDFHDLLLGKLEKLGVKPT